MSKIIAPKQQIVIDIDGLSGQASMHCSHEMPYPMIVYVLSSLLANISMPQATVPPTVSPAFTAATPGGKNGS